MGIDRDDLLHALGELTPEERAEQEKQALEREKMALEREKIAMQREYNAARLDIQREKLKADRERKQARHTDDGHRDGLVWLAGVIVSAVTILSIAIAAFLLLS